MTFRYIGSKARLVSQIKTHIGPPRGGFFVDAFCGTGAVAEAAADQGWVVRLNDHLASATIAAAARLTSKYQARFVKLGGYAKALHWLNATKPTQGFIWREYSPASIQFCGIERRYFTERNAGRIDAMRALIKEWRISGVIDATEERLLIADLFSALNRVANIAGTFGCFLAKWMSQAEEPISVRPRVLKERRTRMEVSIGDVFAVESDLPDVVYLDPPYTKRQYASYYHILETVALADEPPVSGVAGLRPWKDLASDFCYKIRALKALSRLIDKIRAERILLSYSSEGHIALDDLQAEIEKKGRVTVHPLGKVGRYRPNKVASSTASEVKEYLIVIEPRAVAMRVKKVVSA